MELTITISDADIAKLADAITERLLGATSAEAPVMEIPKADPEPDSDPIPVTLSLGDLRGLAKALVSEKGAPGRDALVRILGSFGAKNLTTLDDAKFADVAAAIRSEM